jgi:hypothetical protein
MLKSTAIAVTMTALILLTACGGEARTKEATISEIVPPDSLITERASHPQATDEIDFETGQFINLESYQDQLSAEDVFVLEVLENNLVSLVEHNNIVYRSGFVNEKLAEAMKYYYDDQLQYRFTDIESIETNLPRDNVHINVIGQRLDLTTETIEDVKMMYAFRQNDQGKWMIHTID